MSEEHLDLDELADVLAGAADPHVDGCAQCRADLAELRAIDDDVRSRLALLPTPALPPDVAERLDDALAQEPPFTESGSGAVTTLPVRRDRAQRWLPAAAAAVLVLGGAAFGVTQLAGDDGGADQATSAGGDSAGTLEDRLDLVRNSTGRDYTGRADLATAAPDLLAGSSQVTMAAPAPAAGAESDARASADAPAAAAMTADPLATLRTDAGLAECLLALLPPDDPSAAPLALDYASFKGTPAMVVLLPSALPRKIDVFVVGAGCTRANDSVLFYTSVDAP